GVPSRPAPTEGLDLLDPDRVPRGPARRHFRADARTGGARTTSALVRQQPVDEARQTPPPFRLGRLRAHTGFGDAVELRLAPVFRGLPITFDPAALFEAH